MTALAMMRLLPPAARRETGTVILADQDTATLSDEAMRRLRGSKIAMIFQEPSSYLNPLFTVGDQVGEAFTVHAGPTHGVRERVADLFREVGLPERTFYAWPHQLSGGMLQRVLIAMALINNPPVIVADEPTTALDITTAMQILDLLRRLREKHGLSVVFITHDVALARFFAGRMAVMYAGRVVETGPSADLFTRPLHPYTELLIGCLPEHYGKGSDIRTIPGTVPDFRNLPAGCAFHPRCPYVMEQCKHEDPGVTVRENSRVRCFKHGNLVEHP